MSLYIVSHLLSQHIPFLQLFNLVTVLILHLLLHLTGIFRLSFCQLWQKIKMNTSNTLCMMYTLQIPPRMILFEPTPHLSFLSFRGAWCCRLLSEVALLNSCFHFEVKCYPPFSHFDPIIAYQFKGRQPNPTLPLFTTASSKSGAGSGASASSLYTVKNAFSAYFVRLVILSISAWYPGLWFDCPC